MDRTLICTAAAREAANALAASLGNGPDTFQVPRSTTQGVTDLGLATHYCGSGPISDAVATGLRQSLDPMTNVLDQVNGETFESHCASMQTNGEPTPLFPIYPPL